MPIIGNGKDYKILDAQKESVGYSVTPGETPPVTVTTNSAVAQDDIPF